MKRTLWPLAALVMLAVIGAGCGGTQSSSGTSTAAGADTSNNSTAGQKSALTPREQAVKLTECMRANGVSDFPDPNASGAFPTYAVSVSKTTWTNALRACKKLQPPGFASAKLSPVQMSAARLFAQCVRAHGVPDFPDPVNGQPLIDTTRIPSSNRPGGMTVLNAATHKCGQFLAEQTGGK